MCASILARAERHWRAPCVLAHTCVVDGAYWIGLLRQLSPWNERIVRLSHFTQTSSCCYREPVGIYIAQDFMQQTTKLFLLHIKDFTTKFFFFINNSLLKAVDTIGNCQRLAFTVGVSQHMHKITNL